LFDADPNGQCTIDYSSSTFVPNFSHHKLTCFEYADGVNNVNITDAFQTYSTDRTDLDMYYEKVGLAYGQASGRAIEPDYPSSGLDIQPKIDEYRIVGSTGASVGITSIKAGDGWYYQHNNYCYYINCSFWIRCRYSIPCYKELLQLDIMDSLL
jgi:hypothetical protein